MSAALRSSIKSSYKPRQIWTILNLRHGYLSNDGMSIDRPTVLYIKIAIWSGYIKRFFSTDVHTVNIHIMNGSFHHLGRNPETMYSSPPSAMESYWVIFSQSLFPNPAHQQNCTSGKNRRQNLWCRSCPKVMKVGIKI